MTTIAAEPMAAAEVAALTEFARTTKAAARAVSLYPPTHPSIRAALRRVVTASARLTEAGDVTLSIQPDTISIAGRAPARVDPGVAEFAELLHDRLIGTLAISREADASDWQALLTLLARAPADLFSEGGIGHAWTATGRTRFHILEIDYAELLREREAGGDDASWERIVAFCLRRDATSLDDEAFETVMGIISDPARFGALIERVDNATDPNATLGQRAAVLLSLLHQLAEVLTQRRPDEVHSMIWTAAAALSRLTPEMLLALLAQSRLGSSEDRALVDEIVESMGDGSIASFVAGSIIADRGATARLAEAFQALVPNPERKERLVERARVQVETTALGSEPDFELIWREAATLLTSYSDANYVSAEYGRELSAIGRYAIEVERVSDDPPDRVRGWLSTLGEGAVDNLDRLLLLDLLRIECDPAAWKEVAATAATEIEQRALRGEAAFAEPLLTALVQEKQEGRAGLKTLAARTLESLAAGRLVRHVVVQLRNPEDTDLAVLTRICHGIGPAIVTPLAEALSVEENTRAIRRLREVLVGFGAAGRHSVEQLKLSTNPDVRRTAIGLLRAFGGSEALQELVSMLGDAEPTVQRDTIRAIVDIGTEEAYAMLEQQLVNDGPAREPMLRQLMALRDGKVIPLLCHVLHHTSPRGKATAMHVGIIAALGNFRGYAEAISTLEQILHRGWWWAPRRTFVLRQAAAEALRRIGTAESFAVLEQAAARGGRGVRRAVRPHIAAAAPRHAASR